jgi:hypothetical protein
MKSTKNVNDLTGAALDWAVTKCQGFDHEVTSSEWGMWGWATDWAQGGAIIELEGIGIERDDQGVWFASYDLSAETAWGATGSTPLIAAMRCYVAATLGKEIEIPEELK